jgi:hypothetical protein
MLARLFFEGEVAGGGGALEIDHLGVLEVDGSGRMTAVLLFEPADLDAAYDELDNCFAAGEAAGCARAWAAPRAAAAAWNARDFDAILAIFTPDYVHQDHRRLLWGAMLSDPALFIRSLQLMVEMAPDFRCRIDRVVCLAERGALVEAVEMGTRDGGPFETRYFWVAEVDAEGRIPRFDLYDLDQIDQARARFAELAASAPSAEAFANAASATAAPVIAAIVTHDWQRFAQLFADDFRMSDRRRVVQLELDRDQYVAFTREVANWGTGRAESELLATRGERLALTRLVYEFSGGDVGPSEIAFLILTEVDERGRIVAYVRWDMEDLDAAYAELDTRWRADEATAHPRVAAYQAAFTRALGRRDWDALAALHSPTLVAHDHRLVGWDVLRGPNAYVGALRAMVDLAPDALGRVDHVRTSERGLLAGIVWVGTREGGAFESPFLWVVELDAEGLAQRLDFYDQHHFDQGRARFEEVRTSAPPAPLAATAKPNAAVATLERWQAAFDAGFDAFDADDWEAMRGLCASGMVFEDRRRLALLSGDRELMIASARERARTGARPETQLMGTAGDRLALQRIVWRTGETSAGSEIEVLELDEVDRAGRFVRVLMFDPDDRAAASAELFERWAASGDHGLAPAALDGVRAWNAHDLERLRALVPADFYLDDRRRTGVGRLDGVDVYLGSLAAVWELSRDLRIETLHIIANEPHGTLYVCRWFGTNAEGGEFDAVYVCLALRRGDRAVGLEIFELEDFDAAQARFEESSAATA